MSGTNLVNLDELIPGLAGTKIIYQGNEYRIRGDLPSGTVFEFLALYDDLLKFRSDALEAAQSEKPDSVSKTKQQLETITAAIEKKLLEVFRLEHPDMDEWPFGNVGTLAVLAEVLKTMGLGGAPVEPDPLVSKPKAARKPSTTKRSSRRAAPSRSKARAAR